MEIIEHSLTWIKGEIFEARLILLFSLLTILSAFLFWKVGATPNAKAMLFPLLVAGIMFGTIGIGMLYNNPKRVVEFQKTFTENPKAFTNSEKERVETFVGWYPKTRIIFAILGAVGIFTYMLWASPIGRAIGIALIIMMLATFVIDHFSEERAEIYYKKIEVALKSG